MNRAYFLKNEVRLIIVLGNGHTYVFHAMPIPKRLLSKVDFAHNVRELIKQYKIGK